MFGLSLGAVLFIVLLFALIQRGVDITIILLVILLCFLAGGGGYYAHSHTLF